MVENTFQQLKDKINSTKVELPNGKIIEAKNLKIVRVKGNGGRFFVITHRDYKPNDNYMELGYIYFDFSPNKKKIQVTGLQTGVEVHENFQGAGIGSLLYLVAAYDVFKTSSAVLEKSLSLSPEVKDIWKRFNRRGLTLKAPIGKESQLNPQIFQNETLSLLHKHHLKIEK
jgi:GNAT superfamily N-acetyltransferase